MEYEKSGYEKEGDFSVDASKVETPYRAWSISTGGSILSSPSIVDGMIVFGSNDTYVYALDLEGNKLWSYKTNDIVFSSPTACGDTIVVGSSDQHLYAFSRNGDLRWKFLTGSKVWSTPLVVDGVVYIGSNNGIFHALSLEDGKELWRFHASNQEFFMSASAVNDSIIFGNMSGLVYCVSSDGRLLWKLQCGEHTTQTPLVVNKDWEEIGGFHKRSFYSMPRDNKSRIVIGSGDGYMRCLDVEDGALLWKFFANSLSISSPAIQDKTICFGSHDGRLYLIDTDGHIKWKFQTGNRVVSSPLFHDDTVYFGSSDNNAYALSHDGELLWRFLTDGEIVSSPVVHKDVIYFGSWDGHLYALSIKDCTLLWKFRTALGFPSYIKKPTMTEEKKQAMNFIDTGTTKGYNVKSSNYSLLTGEMTNAFYTSSPIYKRKSPYDIGEKY